MHSDSLGKRAVAPLFLRIALAVIFIYNGALKINEKTVWGAAWADKFWENSGKLPEDVAVKFDQLADAKDVRKPELQLLREKLGQQYEKEAGTLPGTLSFQGVQLAVAWGELVGGVCLLLGVLTRLWAILMIAVQVGAIWTFTLAQGFASPRGGYEFNLALIAMCLALLVAGGGVWSIDHYWWTRRRQQQAAPVAVAA
jgi:uncharacterized membrane protein YphA (DoxX/SURF4 family)